MSCRDEIVFSQSVTFLYSKIHPKIFFIDKTFISIYLLNGVGLLDREVFLENQYKQRIRYGNIHQMFLRRLNVININYEL